MLDRPRVLLVAAVYSPPFSGAGYMSGILRDLLSSNGFDVVHLNARFVKDLGGLERRDPRKALLLLFYSWRLARLLMTGRFHAVVLTPAFSRGTFVKDLIFTFICASVFGQRTIWWAHAHGMRDLWTASGRTFRHLIEWTLRRVDRVVVLGQRHREDFSFGCPPDRMAVIPMGIPAEPSGSHEEGRIKRVLYFSNLETEKGWLVLLDAAQAICEEREDVRFDFFGNPGRGWSRSAVEDRFRRVGHRDRIEYRGPAYGAAKRSAFSDADIFCFPTYFRAETFGVVTLEAMRAGLPVVATDHAASPELVVDGKGGLIVPVRDPAALKDALCRLLDDSSRSAAMGLFNRRRWELEYTLEVFGRRWTALLNES